MATSDQMFDDPGSLVERLLSSDDPLCEEAARRIKTLEKLCGMMTDTGVFLEARCEELSIPDVYWIDGEEENTSKNIAPVLDMLDPLEIYDLRSGHHLPRSYAVKFPELLEDDTGRIIEEARCEEYLTYKEAFEAVRVFRKTALEYGVDYRDTY